MSLLLIEVRKDKTVDNTSEQEKVLVVDDEATIRRILETRLKLAG